MKCVYINLDAEIGRRQNIEVNFNKYKFPDWSLARFAAIDAIEVERRKIAGALRPAQKACIASHLQVIKDSMAHDEDVFILEDDAVFGPRTASDIDRTLAGECRSLDWDMLFTDIGVEGAPEMVELLNLRRQTAADDSVQIVNMKTIPSFFGSTAYIVNAKSKKKFLECFASLDAFDIEYDMYFRKFIAATKLKAYCLFPFVTTIAPEADSSSIQIMSAQNPEMIMNTYRRLLFREAETSFLAHQDEWPADEVILQEAACRIFGMEQRPDTEAMIQLGEQWRPWRGVAAHLLRDYHRRKIHREGARHADVAGAL